MKTYNYEIMKLTDNLYKLTVNGEYSFLDKEGIDNFLKIVNDFSKHK